MFALCCRSLLLMLLAMPVLVHAEQKTGSLLTFSDAWLRAVPPVSPAMAGYVTLHNSGDTAVSIVGLQSPVAGMAMLHQVTVNDQGAKQMQALAQLVVPAGESVMLRSGQTHLMLMQLRRVPAEGERVPVCFLVQDNKTVCADFSVRRVATE